ncbi:MAG: hypothetical protein ABIA21_03085 [Candidatus Aenigmatarchaeota archaeon]
MKINIQSDKRKAESLLRMAKMTLQRLNKTDKLEYPSNTLDDYYDIIHQLLEAIALSNGIKIKGESAHYELINYIFDNFIRDPLKKGFLQELREYRNKISYEGFQINKNYIEQNDEKILEIISILEKFAEKDISMR